MSMLDESYRLHHFRHGEIPDSLHVIFEVKSDNVQEFIAKVVSVMELVVEHGCTHWPDDDCWRDKLPEWLLQTFKSYTSQEIDEILSDKSRWADYAWPLDSWLDRMRERDWQWWSLEDTGEGRITIFVIIEGYPYSTKTLEHLLVAAGGDLSETIA